MNKPYWKIFCVAVGIILFATGISAQQETRLSEEKILKAENDIMAMSEVELRAFVGVIVDCSIITYLTNEQSRIVCHSTRQKYRIEYQRDRAVDSVLYLLELEASIKSGAATRVVVQGKKQDPSDRQISLDDIKRVVREAQLNLPSSSLDHIVQVETRFEKAESQSFKNKRQQ
jgi:hypothetical protein